MNLYKEYKRVTDELANTLERALEYRDPVEREKLEYTIGLLRNIWDGSEWREVLSPPQETPSGTLEEKLVSLQDLEPQQCGTPVDGPKGPPTEHGIDVDEKDIQGLREDQLRHDLEHAMNGQENRSNTPDFLLADFLIGCLRAFEGASNGREAWYGHSHSPGHSHEASTAVLSLLDWAETILCNSQAGKDHTPETWSTAFHKWMDAKHAVLRPVDTSPQDTFNPRDRKVRLGDVLQTIENEPDFPEDALSSLRVRFGPYLGSREFDALTKAILKISKETRANISERMKFI